MKTRLLVGGAVLLAVLVTFMAQNQLWGWFVEDAAISFAYARNLAEGWGLVRFPGDERIEGYSNPLWVFLMAGWHVLGWDGFVSSKWMALALAAVTLPSVAVLIGRSTRPAWGILAAWVLGLDAAFVIWSASGLENSLFCALLALALVRTHVEADEGRWPLAPLVWFGLALTRPEGVVYAALGGLWFLVQEAAGHRRWRRLLAWVGFFGVPFVAYHAVRYSWFAYPFPATYYAKIGEDPFRPFQWSTRGWTYLRRYGQELGRFWLAPVFIAGVVGLRGRRLAVVVGLSVWLGVVLVWPGVEPFFEWGWIQRSRVPQGWVVTRVVSIALILVLTGLAGLRAEGWRVRLLAYGSLLIGLAFCVRAGGDWMRGYRWLSLMSVPATLLFVLGVRDIAERIGSIRSALAGGIATFLVVVQVAPQLVYLAQYEPETTPHSVLRRVDHYRKAMRRLHLDHADIVDHDMGAMLYWGRDMGIVRDSRGLIDIAYALHRSQRAFVTEYAFEEYPFDFAHGHASTGTAMRMQGLAWTQGYLEFPGYGRNTLHTANFVRKDHLVRPWRGPTERSMTFAGAGASVVLHGLDLPAPEVTPGSWLYAEIGLQVPENRADLRVLVFLYDEDGLEVSWDVPLGLEDWYPLERWKKGETVVGRVTFPLSPDLPLGTYAVGVAVLTSDGVVAATEPSPDPVFVEGEHRFDGVAVRLVDKRAMGAAARDDIRRSLKDAASNQCLRAVTWWRRARAHRANSRDWKAANLAKVSPPIGQCFARRALRNPRPKAVENMREALKWARTDPQVQLAGQTLADIWEPKADEARAAGDVEAAYGLYRDVVFVDPSRAWARRAAEELRVERLELKH